MQKDERLIVGLDFCEDYVQLSCFDQKLLRPVSVCKSENEEEYLIPTRLALKIKQHEWIIGDELEDALKSGEEIVEINDFFSSVIEGKEMEVEGEIYCAGHLMQIFFRRIFFVLKTYYPYRELAFLGVTFEKIGEVTVSVMKDAMERLEMNGKYALLDHDEAFLYHVIHRRKEAFVNDTAMFELKEEGMSFSVLHIDPSTSPVVAKISEKYLSENLTRAGMEEDPKKAALLFETLSLMALEGRFISNIYAVGRGFRSSWADEVLRKLSPGRRVFRGQNLFVNGACYLARMRSEKGEEDIVFLGVDRIAAGISILAVKGGREQEVVLAGPSLKWFEAERTLDLIVKGEDELCIQIKDFLTKKITRRFLSLSGINLSGNDLSRIRLHVKFKDKNTCIIKAMDLGFGSFVPTTNRVWELTWEK